MKITTKNEHWAEQDPDLWYTYVCLLTKRILEESKINATLITGICISYQMHGLVLVDKKGEPLRDAIIWCDSRAIEIGNKALNDLGVEMCMTHLLNGPGNFTASKLKWVINQYI